MIGKDGSPSCGVSQTWHDETGHGPGQGVFIRELKKKLESNQLDVPVIGVADFKQEETIAWLEERLNAT